MGLFDEVRCKYPLPWPEVQDAIWQSKDTPVQFLDFYVIREDGTLWHEAWDRRVVEDPATPLGCFLYRDNPRWEQVLVNGEIEIHECTDTAWYSVRFWFRGGKVADMITTKRSLKQA